MSRRFYLSAALAGAAVLGTGLGFAVANPETPRSLVLKDRLAARWQALKLTEAALGEGAMPEAWHAGVFLSAGLIRRALDQVAGFQLENRAGTGALAGTKVTLDRIVLTPRTGQLAAEVALTAVSERSGLALNLTGAANVHFAGMSTAADGASLARFGIELLDLQPAVRFGTFEWKLQDFWGALAADLAVLLARPDFFEVAIPLSDRVAASLGFDFTRTEQINDVGGTVTYRATMPESIIEERLTFSAPVAMTEGVWLLGRRSQDGQATIRAPAVPDVAVNTLATEIAALEAKVGAALSGKAPAGQDLQLFAGRDAFLAIANRIAGLPADKRQVTIQTITRTGRLAEANWRDDLLGRGGAFAELNGDRAGSAVIGFSPPRASWDNGVLRLALDASARANASIHVHVDPLIGGGVGTTLGIEGSGGGRLAARATPRLYEHQGGKVAALDMRLECGELGIDVATDGRLKADFGWMSVPRLGARVRMPVGRDPLAPMLLLDARPHFVRMPEIDPDGAGPWTGAFRHRAIRIVASPSLVVSDGAGIRVGATVTLEPIVIATGTSALEAAEGKVRDEATVIARRTKAALDAMQDAARAEINCQSKPKVEILLGNFAFGPNNEIVRFFVALGKLPQAALDEARRLGGELSADKVRQWLANPEDSFRRSEVGRQLDRLQHETSPEKIEGWVRNPGDSLRRGSLNPGNWFR